MKPAQKSDLAIVLQMSTQHINLALNRLFSKDEVALLKLGFIPQEMEDKWFIYFEDNTLHFHRSWSGFCIYQVFFIETGDALHMTRALVNRDPEQYKETQDERDVETISRVINALLLHR